MSDEPLKRRIGWRLGVRFLFGFAVAGWIYANALAVGGQMNVLLPELAVAFAAICWLAVRVANNAKRSSKWTLTVVAVPLLYVAAFPFAMTLIDQPWTPRWVRRAGLTVYGPYTDLLVKLSDAVLGNE